MEPAPAFPPNTPVLREVPPLPMHLSRNLAVVHPATATNDSALRDYLSIVIKRVWVIVGTLGVVFVARLVAILRATPIYDAVCSSAINKQYPMLAILRDQTNTVR